MRKIAMSRISLKQEERENSRRTIFSISRSGEKDSGEVSIYNEKAPEVATVIAETDVGSPESRIRQTLKKKKKLAEKRGNEKIRWRAIGKERLNPRYHNC